MSKCAGEEQKSGTGGPVECAMDVNLPHFDVGTHQSVYIIQFII